MVPQLADTIAAKRFQWDKFLSNRLALLSAVLFIAACPGARDPAGSGQADKVFVGSDKCASCHETEYREWQGSHHHLAMQVASNQTVLGDFYDASFDYFGITSRFTTENGRFYIETDNAEGANQKFGVFWSHG